MIRFVCFISVIIFITIPGLSQTTQQPPVPSIVPAPVNIQTGKGVFKLLPSVAVSCPVNNPEARKIAELLAARVGAVSGFTVPVREGIMTASLGNIVLNLNPKADNNIGNEGYQLKLDPTLISISANTPAGLFYGVQTLLQILPDAQARGQENKEIMLPELLITDFPRFAWRGLMFDVSRHFFTKDEVKRYIDDMVKYKFNLLHMHLTDDQGWRIEIKSLPRLTEVGAWNVKKTGRFGYFSKPDSSEPRNYGGFYTQDDIRELVQYAKDRYMNILPEIDIPGHSLAALAAYPDLSGTAGTYQVNSGEKFMEWPATGHFYGLIDNTLNPAKENVYVFLDKVFTEVAAIFPFEYIHMGGDETARNFWEKSEDIKKLMAREKLKNLDEVQSYFVKRVSKIVTSKGKKLIGWDEILEGGLVQGAAVMSWRGMKGGEAAAKLGHEVVMSPTTFAYLDYMQGDKVMEPLIYASLRMNKAYTFEPVPEGVNPALIKGGQANLWTEQVYNLRQAQYMTWPRGMAIAEVVWSPKSKRNWNDFINRVEGQLPRLDAAGTKYAPSMYEPDIKATKEGTNGVTVEFVKEIESIDCYYSFDNSYPDNYYPKYSSPVPVPKDATQLRIISYKGNKQVGRPVLISVEELRKRAGY
jgi:hexosaminidase